MRDYKCVRCGREFESLKNDQYVSCKYCDSMAERQNKVYAPGYFRSGKYGKAGGLSER